MAMLLKDWSSNDMMALMDYFNRYVTQNPQDARQVLMENEKLTRVVSLVQLRLGMLSNVNEMEDEITEESHEDGALDPEQQELLQQVKNITSEVLRALPKKQQTQIQELRLVMGLPAI